MNKAEIIGIELGFLWACSVYSLAIVVIRFLIT